VGEIAVRRFEAVEGRTEEETMKRGVPAALQRTTILMVWALSGCGGDDGSTGDANDLGEATDVDDTADTGDSADVGGCRVDDDCDDGTFCNGVERCLPEDEAADERGCVPGTSPCLDGETCDEELDDCLPECEHELDADGDGHINELCGGDDCDDGDINRFAGNVEVCDGEGHDEDCNEETFGFLDADGDGVASSACCNGIECGGDCNDADAEINPRASDGPPVDCDGIDNDCSGTADEGCPCVEGETRECGTEPQLARIGECEPGTQICADGAFTTE
jgi:hypothetical protein